MLRAYKAYKGKIDADIKEAGQEWFAIATGQSTTTANKDHAEVFRLISNMAQKISLSKGSEQDGPNQKIVSTALQGYQRVFLALSQRRVTLANDHYDSDYSRPPEYAFTDWPLRWPGRSLFALDILQSFCEAGHVLSRVNSNQVEKGIPQIHAALIARPLYNSKASIMRNVFGKEVEGELSPDEITALFRDSKLIPPLVSSLTTTFDSAAEKVNKDQAALSEESSPNPTVDSVRSAINGKDVWTWMPTKEDYATMAAIAERTAEPEGPQQRPSEPFPFSTEVITNDGASGGDNKAE